MGGGTTLVEAMVAGRRSLGCDVNSLAAFVARVKTTRLTKREVDEVVAWAAGVLPNLSHRIEVDENIEVSYLERTRNLDVPRARAIKKIIALALESLTFFEHQRSQEFARCVLLNVSQWALNGRRSNVSLSEFRQRIVEVAMQMIDAMADFGFAIKEAESFCSPPLIVHDSAAEIGTYDFSKSGKIDLVITSPPYPGIHVLYHRWQVDGRKETPAPYWIANCLDGAGSKFYNFGSRDQHLHDEYFKTSLETLLAIRKVMKRGAMFVQMIAFSNPKKQFQRYLENMAIAGFEEAEIAETQLRRIWRPVPGRAWHAELNGQTSGAREVVLIHRAC